MSDFPEDIDENTPTFTAINMVKDEPNTGEPALDEIKVKDEEEPEDSPAPSSVTPKKRTKKAKDGAAAASGGTPSKKPKSADSTPKKGANPIPTSREAAGMADKLILRMRDEEGKGWQEINSAWSALTGITVGKSTLPMRYQAMKANFTSVGADDEARLLKAKKDVEDKFESEKWHKIADAIEADGGSKYPVATLTKKFRELTKKSAIIEVKDED